jgi:uncharacterized protein (DUF58 family)
VTWRGAGLLIVSIAVVAGGAAVPALSAAGLLLLLVFGVAIAVDSRRAPGKTALHVERVCADLLSVGVPNRV